MVQSTWQLQTCQIIHHLDLATWSLFSNFDIDTVGSRCALVFLWVFVWKFWKVCFSNVQSVSLAFASRFGVPHQGGSFQSLKWFAFWASGENSTNHRLWVLRWCALRLPDLWWKVYLTNAWFVFHKGRWSRSLWACFLRFGIKYGYSWWSFFQFGIRKSNCLYYIIYLACITDEQ